MDKILKFLFIFSLLGAFGCAQRIEGDPLVAIQIQDRNGITETISTPDRIAQFERLDFLATQPYKKVLRIFRKDGINHSKISTYHPNGAICQYLEAEEMRAHGAYKEWHPNGRLKIEAYVIGGTADVATGSQRDWLFDGATRAWDEQGNLLAEIPYVKGSREGKSLYFYPSGTLETEIPYADNHIEGELLHYFKDGKLRSKQTYRKGVQEGLSIGYYTTGQGAWIEEYNEGLLVKGGYFDPKGDLFSSVENGDGRQALFEGDLFISLVEIRRGSPDGMVKNYTPQGKLKSTYFIKNGKKQGDESEYFLSSELERDSGVPTPKLSIQWKENAISGTVKTWYPNGQLQSQREFSRNKKLGPSLAWYKNGSLMLLEEYEDDQLIKGTYYKKGVKNPISEILNGTGTAYLYDGEGILIKKVIYVKGKAVDPED
jgi:antitoxin component YwqK of YwqJK toxin-antitoxin module